MFWLIGAIFLGNLLAIAIHCGCWVLRRRAIGAVQLFGLIGIIGFVVFTGIGIEMARLNSFVMEPEGQVVQLTDLRSAQLSVLGKSSAVLLLTLLIALYQFRQVPMSFTETFLSVWAEVFIGFCVLLAVSALIWPPSSQWISFSFIISLIGLNIMPIWICKLISTILQIWRDWFSLNYQWKKSKF